MLKTITQANLVLVNLKAHLTHCAIQHYIIDHIVPPFLVESDSHIEVLFSCSQEKPSLRFLRTWDLVQCEKSRCSLSVREAWVSSRPPHSGRSVPMSMDELDQVLMHTVLFCFSCCAINPQCCANRASRSWTRTVSSLWIRYFPEPLFSLKSLITIFIPVTSANDLLLHG